MTTFYILYDPTEGTFIRAGRYCMRTFSLNAAKHFTSEWSAKQFCDRNDCGDHMIIKKIQRY